MGDIQHRAMLVTCWDEKRLAKARAKARELGLYVSGISSTPANGMCTFAVWPDGSKDGWDLSEQMIDAQWSLREWLMEEEHCRYYEWVAVRYGPRWPDGEPGAGVTDFYGDPDAGKWRGD